MPQSKKKQAHLWQRDELDWYIEPAVCSLALFGKIEFKGPIWDPACGIGRILKSADASGLSWIGTDIAQRTSDCLLKSDFLNSAYEPELAFDIVSNPPFGVAEEFVLKAISIIRPGKKCAFILPLVWMSGFSTKRDWLPRSPLRYVLPISPRPSMPPGEVIVNGEKPGNGTKDFGWFVWENGHDGPAEVEFLNTNPHKAEAVKLDALLESSICGRQTAA